EIGRFVKPATHILDELSDKRPRGSVVFQHTINRIVCTQEIAYEQISVRAECESVRRTYHSVVEREGWDEGGYKRSCGSVVFQHAASPSAPHEEITVWAEHRFLCYTQSAATGCDEGGHKGPSGPVVFQYAVSPPAVDEQV